MRISLLYRPFAIALSAFLLIEFYYQVNFRFAGGLPSFLRVYSFRYFDSNGTPRFPASLSAWHRSYGNRPDVKIHINSHGFRGADPLPAPKERIMMLGDSVVFNGAVEEPETFSVMTEVALRARLQEPNLEVLNFGVGDINARQYYLKLKNHALLYHPNLVLVFLYLNDAADNLSSSFDTAVRDSRIPWYHSFAAENLAKLGSNLHLLFQAHTSGRFSWVEAFSSRAYLNDGAVWKRMLTDAQFDWGGGWSRESWRAIESWLVEMTTITRNNNIELWTVVVPVKPQLEMHESTPDLFLPQMLAQEMADRVGVPNLNPLPFFRQINDADGLMYDQCHLTVKGNRSLSDFLTPHLEKWVRDSRGRRVGP